jgi:hypothetical protein
MADNIPSRMDSDRAYYSAHFMDPAVWEPLVQQVCLRHGLKSKRLDPGVAGTFPTFLVELEAVSDESSNKAVVVKFFGPLFDGAGSFHIEKEIGYWLDQHTLPVHSPAILPAGHLDRGWSYLIFECVHGDSILKVRQHLSAHAWEVVARQMGSFLKALHTVSTGCIPGIRNSTESQSWSDFITFLDHQRDHCLANHQLWCDLPAHLLPQLPDYLLPVEQLIDLSSSPHLIHADLTADHLLGYLSGTPTLPPTSEWNTLAIIDWGDARIGNILYELVALHLGLFQADKQLLKICLDCYGLPDFYQQDFARKALCMLLLHQFPMPARVYAPFMHARNLNEIAQALFEL